MAIQQLGEQQQRGLLVSMASNIRVVAAALARPPLGRTEATERRSSGLHCIDGQCSQRMILAVVWRLVCATAGTFQDA